MDDRLIGSHPPAGVVSRCQGRPRGLKGSMPRRGAPKFVRDKVGGDIANGVVVGFFRGGDHGTKG